MESIKYIVYLTICKTSKRFYIGVPGTSSRKFEGYLGNGVYTNKPSSYKRSETPFRRAVNKYGPDDFVRITLFEYDTEEEAYKKEEEIVTIEFLKRSDVYNATIGGNKPPEWATTPMYQYDLDGNFIKEFPMIKDAAVSVNVRPCSISDAAKEHNNCNGYLWSYYKYEKIAPYTNKRAKRKVAVYTKDGKLLKIYDTINSCRKDYNGCIQVLYGRQKFHKQCIFKFVE